MDTAEPSKEIESKIPATALYKWEVKIKIMLFTVFADTYNTFAKYAQDIMEMGKDRKAPTRSPDSKDVAVVMYTSGSTGNPKGVMMYIFKLFMLLLSN